MGKEGEFAAEFAGYQDAEGVKMPTKVKMTFAGNVFDEEECSEFKFGPVDAKVLEQPAQVEMGKIVEKKLPAMTLACGTYKGAYDGMGPTLGKLMAFVEKEKMAPAGPMMMSYLKSPPAVKDPKKFVTEVCLPVAAPAPKKPAKKGEYTIKATKPMKVMAVYGQGDYGKTAAALMEQLMKEVKAKKAKPAGPYTQAAYMDPTGYEPDQLISEMGVPIK